MQDDNQGHLFTELGFDHTARQHILSIASWAMIVVVVSVIGYILNLVQIVTGAKEAVPQSEGFGMVDVFAANNTTSSVISIIIGLLINFFLYRFASMARSGINELNQDQLNRSFNNLKFYFVTVSVILIVVFAAVILFAIAFAMKAV